jgi:hypothetical protein
MTGYAERLQLKYAAQSLRKRTIAEPKAIEALIDAVLPENPGPGIQVPQGKATRKRYWKENGIRSGRINSRNVSRDRSKNL